MLIQHAAQIVTKPTVACFNCINLAAKAAYPHSLRMSFEEAILLNK